MRNLQVAGLLVWTVASAQTNETGWVERNGNQAVLIVDHPRPVDAAALTLAAEFGIRVNVEDPQYLYKDDVKDVTATVSRDHKVRGPVLIPRGGHLEARFSVGTDGAPSDAGVLLNSLVDAANAQFPFGYRLDVDGRWFTITPTRTRDSNGQIIAVTPLLDRRVTIPPGTRSIAETANLMAEALSAQTGLRVSCCQAFVGGIPWGMGSITYEAHDEQARAILKRLIAEATGNQPNRDFWLERCDPLPSTWCFINLSHINGADSVKPAMAPPLRQHGEGKGAKWFDRSQPKP